MEEGALNSPGNQFVAVGGPILCPGCRKREAMFKMKCANWGANLGTFCSWDFTKIKQITLRLFRASSDLATHFAPIGGLSEERGSEPRIWNLSLFPSSHNCIIPPQTARGAGSAFQPNQWWQQSFASFHHLQIIYWARIFKLFWSQWIDSKKSIPPVYVAWARIFKRLWSPGIDSKEWIPPAYVAWRAGTITIILLGT